MNAYHRNPHDFLEKLCNETADTNESVVEILYDHFAEFGETKDPRIQSDLKRLRAQLQVLGVSDPEPILNIVFELCSVHEECGFRGGLSMGMTLARELSSFE